MSVRHRQPVWSDPPLRQHTRQRLPGSEAATANSTFQAARASPRRARGDHFRHNGREGPKPSQAATTALQAAQLEGRLSRRLSRRPCRRRAERRGTARPGTASARRAAAGARTHARWAAPGGQLRVGGQRRVQWAGGVCARGGGRGRGRGGGRAMLWGVTWSAAPQSGRSLCRERPGPGQR